MFEMFLFYFSITNHFLLMLVTHVYDTLQ